MVEFAWRYHVGIRTVEVEKIHEMAETSRQNGPVSSVLSDGASKNGFYIVVSRICHKCRIIVCMVLGAHAWRAIALTAGRDSRRIKGVNLRPAAGCECQMDGGLCRRSGFARRKSSPAHGRIHL
jgi:hypothetical protein